jgi:hypothetical protein
MVLKSNGQRNGPGVPAKIEFKVLAPPKKTARYIFRLNYL